MKSVHTLVVVLFVAAVAHAADDKADTPQSVELSPDEQRLVAAEKEKKLGELTDNLRTAEAKQKSAVKSRNRKEIEKAKDEAAWARKQLNTFKRHTDQEWLALREQRIKADAEAADEMAIRPLVFKGSLLRKNVINLPELWVTMVNQTKVPVEAYTIIAECFNRFDEPVIGISGKKEFVGITQQRINPKEDKTAHWQLSLHGATGYVNVWVSRVKFSDGTEWHQSKEQAIARGKSFRRVDLQQ